MDRLLQPPYSSTIAPTKSKPIASSPFLPRVHSLTFASSRRAESRRVSSISCLFRQNPSPNTSPGLNQTQNFLFKSPSSSPESNESKPNPGFLKSIMKANCEQRKVTINFTLMFVKSLARKNITFNFCEEYQIFISFNCFKNHWI